MKNNQDHTAKQVFEIPHLFDNRKKTKESLLELYVMIIQDKPQYRYDPQRMIFDLLPAKKELFDKFFPKQEYSLDQSMNDHGRLTIAEHRFINFLKFTDFEESDVQNIFDTHTKISRKRHIPVIYQYSKHELYNFMRSLMPPIDFHITDEDLVDVPMLTAEDVENLHKEDEKVLS